VKSKTFHWLLARLRTGDPIPKDATKITNLHLGYYEHDTEFINYLKENNKFMWLYKKNIDKDKKNLEMLVHTSKHNNVPVARLDCCFGTNRISGQNEPTACRSHFESSDPHTDICVGARVVISKMNHLPEIGLYNWAIGTAVEIV
jgi:hypothetical protein